MHDGKRTYEMDEALLAKEMELLKDFKQQFQPQPKVANADEIAKALHEASEEYTANAFPGRYARISWDKARNDPVRIGLLRAQANAILKLRAGS